MAIQRQVATFLIIRRAESRPFLDHLRECKESAFWSIYAQLYDFIWDAELMDAVGRKVADLCVDSGDMSIIEVGAGTGLISSHLINTKCEYWAFEPNRQMASKLTNRLPRTSVHIDGIDSIPIDGKSHLVIASLVLHVLQDPARSLERLRRLAGHSGKVIIVTPATRASLLMLVQAMHRSGASNLRIIVSVIAQSIATPFIAGLGPPFNQIETHGIPSTDILEVGCVEEIFRILEVAPVHLR